jgi:hypothetical protein
MVNTTEIVIGVVVVAAVGVFAYLFIASGGFGGGASSLGNAAVGGIASIGNDAVGGLTSLGSSFLNALSPGPTANTPGIGGQALSGSGYTGTLQFPQGSQAITNSNGTRVAQILPFQGLVLKGKGGFPTPSAQFFDLANR